MANRDNHGFHIKFKIKTTSIHGGVGTLLPNSVSCFWFNRLFNSIESNESNFVSLAQMRQWWRGEKPLHCDYIFFFSIYLSIHTETLFIRTNFDLAIFPSLFSHYRWMTEKSKRQTNAVDIKRNWREMKKPKKLLLV